MNDIKQSCRNEGVTSKIPIHTFEILRGAKWDYGSPAAAQRRILD